MTADLDYSDLPIGAPEQDLFGIDPFVRSLARSVREMKTPQGVVIALNGPWGSGKSSAMNLLKHHLNEAVAADELDIVSFNPWWFRGEEALVLAFFRELYTATNPSLPDRAKKILPKLGARLLKAGGVVAPAADFMGAGGAGAIASGAMTWLSGLIEDGESVEKLHAELAKGLTEQNKRFVVLIDDIDRLAPDEALAMFRLVKSVGRLPNLIYVLAFDRVLAEKVVSERFPSEGPHYLEKIVQASFELPTPNAADLHHQLLTQIGEMAGSPDERLVVHILNLFHEIVSPEIRTPRDVIRYLNAFSITWPAVAGDVDLGDFAALEAYRLFQPGIYRAIRANRELVCGSATMGAGRSITAEELDGVLLSSVSDTSRYRRGLMRLFPKLESIWSNTFHSGTRWARQRRACAADHFPTYFRLALSEDVVSRQDIDALIANAGNAEWISNKLLVSVRSTRRTGGTRAAVILDAIELHATDVPIAKVEPLLSGIFAVADELDTESDRAWGFSVGNNNLRIHWLMRALLLQRTGLADRSAIVMSAAKGASLGWLAHLASDAWRDYHPREDDEAEGEGECIVTARDADRLVDLALRALKRASRDGTLLWHDSLAVLLYSWRDFAADGGVSVKRWTAARMKEDGSVIRFAAAFTSYSWSQGLSFNGLGDLVTQRNDRAQIDGLNDILDRDRFRSRLETLAKRLDRDSPDLETVSRFLKAWDNRNHELD